MKNRISIFPWMLFAAIEITVFLLTSCTKEQLINQNELPETTAKAAKTHFNPFSDQSGFVQYDAVIENKCYGELVQVTGLLPYRLRQTYVADKRYSISYSFNLDSLHGIGQTSGLIYRGKGFIVNNVAASLDSNSDRVTGRQTYKLTLDAGQTAIIIDEEFRFIRDATGKVLVDTQSITDTCR